MKSNFNSGDTHSDLLNIINKLKNENKQDYKKR